MALDRIDPRKLGALAFSLPPLSLLLLNLQPGITAVAFVTGVGCGIAAGSEVAVLGYLTSRYFPLNSFGVLLSILSSAATLASGLGPLAAGYAYDRLGYYQVPIWIGIVASLSTIPLLLSLPRLARIRPTE